MKVLRTGLFAALLALGLGVGVANAESLPQPASQADSLVEGAMDMQAVDMPTVNETNINATATHVSTRELDGATGRGRSAEADAGLLAKLLMLSAMTDGSSMAGAAFGLQ